MKFLAEFPKEYFEKFNTNPILLKPFDPQSKKIAFNYIKKLKIDEYKKRK